MKIGRTFLEELMKDRNPTVEEEVVERLDPFDLPQAVVDEAQSAVLGLDELDRPLLEFMGAGVRDTAAYAEVMGISHLPVHQQRAAVKRAKDRLKKRMEALRGKLNGAQ
jgi:hypothetical protein